MKVLEINLLDVWTGPRNNLLQLNKVQKMPKVYVVNKGAHDYSAAEKFGTIVFCTEGVLGKYNTSQMVREMQAALADSTADDYLLLTSLSTLCSIASACFALKHKGKLNLLIFKDGQYMERKVVFDN